MLRGTTDWGSQAAKAYLFSTFPKLTESTLPSFKCFRAPWESHAAKWEASLKCSAGLPIGEAKLPRHTFFLPSLPSFNCSAVLRGSRAADWASQAAK